jgi:hypothetical protein
MRGDVSTEGGRGGLVEYAVEAHDGRRRLQLREGSPVSRHEGRHSRVPDHEVEPFPRVAGIERHIRAARFEDPQQPHEHRQRSIGRQPHHALGAHA